jgi:predicted RNA-binding protein YlqC (UPF0109 family)
LNEWNKRPFVLTCQPEAEWKQRERLKSNPGRGTMKKLVEEIAKALVDAPEQVSVNEIESQQSIVVELAVAKQDLGKIIGKKGQNVQAIRTILNAASGKSKKRIILELLE